MFGLPIYAASRRRSPRLVFFLRADAGVTSSGDGTAITAVADQSGRGNNSTSSSPSRPVNIASFFTSGANPAIYFELLGTSPDWLTLPNRISCPNGFSAFVFFQLDDTDSPGTSITTVGNVPLTLVGDSNGHRCNAFGMNGNNVSYSSRGSSTGAFTSVTSTGKSLGNGNVHSIAVTHDIDGRVVIYADGVASGAMISRYCYETGFDTVSAGFGHTDVFWGFMAELRVYDGALTQTDITALHSAAATKWT